MSGRRPQRQRQLELHSTARGGHQGKDRRVHRWGSLSIMLKHRSRVVFDVVLAPCRIWFNVPPDKAPFSRLSTLYVLLSFPSSQMFSSLHLRRPVLLQHGADPNIRNTDGKSALDLADPSAKAVLTGQSLLSALLFHLHRTFNAILSNVMVAPRRLTLRPDLVPQSSSNGQQ